MSEFSGPFQSTTEPSEYVCRTPNEYVWLESARPRNWTRGLARRPLRPVPGDLRDHGVLALAGLLNVARPTAVGMNESIEKPSGGVSSTFVVVASSFSVGTASVNT